MYWGDRQVLWSLPSWRRDPGRGASPGLCLGNVQLRIPDRLPSGGSAALHPDRLPLGASTQAVNSPFLSC